MFAPRNERQRRWIASVWEWGRSSAVVVLDRLVAVVVEERSLRGDGRNQFGLAREPWCRFKMRKER